MIATDEQVLTVALAASALIDILVALAVIRLELRERGPRFGLGRLAASIAKAAIVVAAKGVVMVWGGLDVFGVMHVIYLDLAVAAPAIALVLLVLALRPRTLALTHGARWLLVGVLVMAPAVGIYASFVEPTRLRFERVAMSVDSHRSGNAPITIGILADLQTDRITAYERQAVDRLLAAAPDVIVVPGDLFQGSREQFDRELPALRELMQRLEAPGGVYFVPGNTDRLAWLVPAFAESEVLVLSNHAVTVRVRDRLVTIGGVEWNHRSASAVRLRDHLERREPADDIRVLLTHAPDPVLALEPDSRVDLVIAGHTHGGQVVVPLFGPPITFSRVPRAVAAGGLHELDGNAIYVSRGVGHERRQAPRIRFLCPPEISLIELGGAGAR